jgi:hypothetical protein
MQAEDAQRAAAGRRRVGVRSPPAQVALQLRVWHACRPTRAALTRCEHGCLVKVVWAHSYLDGGCFLNASALRLAQPPATWGLCVA